jgi:hypothetical protein
VHISLAPWCFEAVGAGSQGGERNIATVYGMYIGSSAHLLASPLCHAVFVQDDEGKAPKATLADDDEDDTKDEL